VERAEFEGTECGGAEFEGTEFEGMEFEGMEFGGGGVRGDGAWRASAAGGLAQITLGGFAVGIAIECTKCRISPHEV
jgi:hypothetical protein